MLEQVNLETKDEKYRVDSIKQGVVVAYDRIPKSAQTIRLFKQLIRLRKQLYCANNVEN